MHNRAARKVEIDQSKDNYVYSTHREGPHIYKRINPIKYGKSKALGEGKSVQFVSSATARSKLKQGLFEKRKAKAAPEATQTGEEDVDGEAAGETDVEDDGGEQPDKVDDERNDEDEEAD